MDPRDVPQVEYTNKIGLLGEGHFEDEFSPEEPLPAPQDAHTNDDVKLTVVPAKVVIADQYRSDSKMSRSSMRSISKVSVSKA